MLTYEIGVVLALIVVVLILFLRELLPLHVTALLAALVLMGTGILTPEEGLSGFSSPATIAVLSMFVLSAGVHQTGVVNILTQPLMRWSRNNHRRQLVALGLSAGPASGFINNTPVVAVLIPVALRLARTSGINPSRLLMPISNLAMLGGLLTVIGTSTNLLGNNSLMQMGLRPFAFFEFTAIGAIALGTGLIYYIVAGPWILPDRGPGGAVERYDLKGFLAEYLVLAEGRLVGQTFSEAGLTARQGCLVVRLVRDRRVLDGPPPWIRLQAGDQLLIEASRERLVELGQEGTLQMLPEILHPLDLGEAKEAGQLATAEVVITTGSQYLGRRVADLDFPGRFEAQVLAVRHQSRVEPGPLSMSRLRPGDVLLVQATPKALERLREQPDLFLTRERPHETYRTERMLHASVIIIAVVLVAGLGLLPISVAALAGAVLMVIVGAITSEEFLRSVHWDIILMLAGIIPLGLALEKTGAAALLASGLISVGTHFEPIYFLMLIFVVTSLITEVVSNNASVILLVPITVAAAIGLGIEPRPVALTAILAASTSMMTPVGYQTNTMILAPGNYRFADYIRVGGPLNLILAIVIPLAVAWRFPL